MLTNDNKHRALSQRTRSTSIPIPVSPTRNHLQETDGRPTEPTSRSLETLCSLNFASRSAPIGPKCKWAPLSCNPINRGHTSARISLEHTGRLLLTAAGRVHQPDLSETVAPSWQSLPLSHSLWGRKSFSLRSLSFNLKLANIWSPFGAAENMQRERESV